MNQHLDYPSKKSSALANPSPNPVFLSGKPLLWRLFSALQVGRLEVTLPNGCTQLFTGTHAGPAADLTLYDTRAFDVIMRLGDIGLAQSYEAGWLDSSDLLSLFELALANEAALHQAFEGKWYGKLWYRYQHFRNRNTKQNSTKNIHAHYDLGNDFYQLWLDESMTYSSAYWSSPELTLAQAQQAKYARLFEQLGLESGDRVLEIGCGWGGFAEFAARRGVYVTGVSLSKEQLKYANHRLAQADLSTFCDLRFQDYRDIQDPPFDAIISIEMIEAVGEAFWPSYFAQLARLVKPHGKIAIQAITIDDARFDRYRQSTDFIQQYIFPGGMLPSIEQLQKQTTQVGLSWINAVGFGHDYARTLQQWQDAFEAKLPEIRAQGFDEGFIRIWRLYYVYCQAGFLSDRTSVYQITLQKGDAT